MNVDLETLKVLAAGGSTLALAGYVIRLCFDLINSQIKTIADKDAKIEAARADRDRAADAAREKHDAFVAELVNATLAQEARLNTKG